MSFAVTNQFSDLDEIATQQGFIFPLPWYRVLLGVQIQNTFRNGAGVR
jgi:hypothetical protein